MTPEEYTDRKATMVSAEAFAKATDSVPAERIRCDECAETYIGDPDTGQTCPTCRGGR